MKSVASDGSQVEQVFEVLTQCIHEIHFGDQIFNRVDISKKELNNVDLKGTILKPNMILPGKNSGEKISSEEIANLTLECLKKNTYDQFYNEHIYVFSLIGIESILKKYNLEIFDVQNLKIHGGSNRYFIKRKINKVPVNVNVKINRQKEINYGIKDISTYVKFAKRVKFSKKKLRRIFLELKNKKKNIIIFIGDVYFHDQINDMIIESNKINYNRNSNIIYSSGETLINYKNE